MIVDVLPGRTAALEQVSSLELPTKRDEAWRYAPHKALGALTFGPAAAPAAVPADVDAQIPEIEGPRLVIVNGVFDPERSRLDATPSSLRVESLAEATDEAVVGLLQREYDAAEDAFSIINRAYGTGGALVLVDGRVDKTIHVVNVVAPEVPQAATAARVIVEMAEGSAATLVETRIGSGDVGACNIRTEISLAAGASLEHIVLQDLPTTQIHLGRVDVVQAADSCYQTRLFNLGADYGRVAYHVHLAGEGAEADLSGLYFGFGDQTLDQQITVVHAAANCRTSQSYRGVLDDESTGIWNGGVDVRPGADGTDSVQSNDNLVLSRRAEVNTMPRLEILADEVSCQHGATVGELDEEALYYLRSRGIGQAEARRLLINGFADQVMDDLHDDVLRTWIAERLGPDHA
ncbi:MAG: Fe-S cluster assembly protein SufD [Acidimicrobiales bacterium]|nr:Fe-S cluster assembly protein SufD [Acidimicrobiales bacterium]